MLRSRIDCTKGKSFKELHVTVAQISRTLTKQFASAAGLTACLILTMMAAGCGSSEHPVGTVHGKITYKDEPLQEAVLYVYNRETGEAGEGKVADGSFELLNELKTGTYTAFVTAIPPPPPNPENPPVNLWGNFPKDLPEKYQREDQSDLKIEVAEGDNEVALAIPGK